MTTPSYLGWHCNLLAHRFNELGAAVRADPDLYFGDFRSQIEEAARHLERAIEYFKSPVWRDAKAAALAGHLFEAEVCLEKAERRLPAARALATWPRSPAYEARMRFMYQFIERLRLHVPPIHPSGEEAVHRYFAEMREAMDDPAEVSRLAAMVRDRVVQELRWEAENMESARYAGWSKDAHRKRQQASRFEASHKFEELAHV
jgi:hypothetical protein